MPLVIMFFVFNLATTRSLAVLAHSSVSSTRTLPTSSGLAKLDSNVANESGPLSAAISLASCTVNPRLSSSSILDCRSFA